MNCRNGCLQPQTVRVSASGSSIAATRTASDQGFDALWEEAVQVLKTKMKPDGEDLLDLHVHELRRSAHYQMRKARVDSKTGTTS